jgi:LPXTG-motif cell wall-anchored protein
VITSTTLVPVLVAGGVLLAVGVLLLLVTRRRD